MCTTLDPDDQRRSDATQIAPEGFPVLPSVPGHLITNQMVAEALD